MTSAQTDEPTAKKPLRLWPGVILAVLLLVVRFGVPIVAPGAMAFAMLGGMLGGLAIVVWWAFFSRAPRPDRWGGLILMIVALAVTPRLLHASIGTGNMGLQFFMYAIPVLGLAFVVWAVASRRLPDGARRATMVATILLACGVWTLLRTDGITGDGAAEFAWRWTATPEQRLLAQEVDEPTALPPSPLPAATEADWPGFRGRDRDGVIRGVRIETDWSASPPVELWRRPIGPACSSFAVRGGLLYTQEQRGDDEIVSCYDMATGEPVWRHSDAVRFWDSHAGAGPRATPALGDGHVYTFGATGVLNALDAIDGTVVWSRDVASDTEAEAPEWGFTSSPLLVGDVVIVHTNVLAAYDLATGELRWLGPARGASYSSPHPLTVNGNTQALMIDGAGVIGIDPANGAPLWEHPWPGGAIVQPALAANGDLLISTGGAMGSMGVRRLAVTNAPGDWTVNERWTSTRLKPYFNDFVVHDGHAYGFDGRILACIDLEDGARKWKGGRYGNGQLLVLPDQDLLLVLSEQGELALVAATPDGFAELARVPAIEGKTWNHPVLVGDTLLVRNGQEMAAFRLPLAGD